MKRRGGKTSICVLAPLSGTTICAPTPDQPAFTERFYQYSLKVDSLNSLVLITDTALDIDPFDSTDRAEGAPR
jgi:hypothetical protein